MQDSSSVCLQMERLNKILMSPAGRLLPDLCLECAHTVSLVPVSTAWPHSAVMVRSPLSRNAVCSVGLPMTLPDHDDGGGGGDGDGGTHAVALPGPGDRGAGARLALVQARQHDAVTLVGAVCRVPKLEINIDIHNIWRRRLLEIL